MPIKQKWPCTPAKALKRIVQLDNTVCKLIQSHESYVGLKSFAREANSCIRMCESVCLFLLPSLVLAARLEVELVDLPEVEVVGEGEDAHLLDQVQLARPVKVEDGGEGARVAVEEVLVVRLCCQSGNSSWSSGH